MELLPTNDEQRFLIHGLYDLIEQRGPAPFVAAPLLEPSSTFFPDHWEPSADGVRTLLLRLLAYAGLGELDAEVHLFDDPTRVEASWDAPSRHRGVAGWFAGIEEGVCRFGVDARKIDNAEGLTGVLCHEVAHAYRAHHGIEVADRNLEERLTDLTTIYLGFGVLTVNNTDRHRAGGAAGYRVVTWESHGYLSPQAMSFLLAAQVATRRLGAVSRRRIEGLLEANQAACFEAAWEQLGADPDKLVRRLGLPPRDAWPAPRPIEEIVGPARGAEVPEPIAADGERERGHAARVLRRSRVPYVLAGVVAAVATAAVVGSYDVQGLPVLFLFTGVIAAAIALGVWARADRCSACLHPLRRRHLEACPGCGRPLQGTLDPSGRGTPQHAAPSAPVEDPAPSPSIEASEAPSEMEGHLARLRAVPAIARAHREGDAMTLYRVLRKRREKAKSLAEEEAIDWLLRDPRPRMRTNVRRPPLGGIFALSDVGHHDSADGSDVSVLWIEVWFPLVPLASYVVRRTKGEVEILGRVPLPGGLRLWRGFAALATMLPLIWIVPAIVGSLRGTVHFVSALDVPVVVSIGGERITIKANTREERTLSRGRHRATVTDEGGNVIEQQDITVRGGDRFLTYNVLGAALLVSREALYGTPGGHDAPPRIERHVHQRIVERDAVAFPFMEPPPQIEGRGQSRLWVVNVVPGGWRLTAAALEAEGSRDAAVELTAAVSLAQPFDEEAIRRAVDAALAAGGPDRALQHLARVLERAPTSGPARLARQGVLLGAGRSD